MACLGDPSRFRVIQALRDGERCVTEIARAIGLSQSCTTRHLQTLRQHGLVRRTRVGKRVFFGLRLDQPRAAGLVAWALAMRPGRKPAMGPESPRPASPPEAAAREGTTSPEAEPAVDRAGELDVEVPRPTRGNDLEDYLL